jgi:predicted O-methyltransferase YrrM
MNRLRRWFLAKTRLPTSPVDLTLSTRSLPEADKWILSEFILEKLVPVVGVHPYPLDELLLMCSTVAYFKPGIIIEWGTHLGISARIFYEISRQLSLSVPIHSIDLPPDVAHVENIRDLAQRGRYVRNTTVQLHQGDGLSVARGLLAETKGVLPLIFLDGDHHYETVSRELNGLRTAAPQAVVLVHDTFFQGPEANYNCGPYEALLEFSKTDDIPVCSTALGLPGMTLAYWL